MGENDTSQFCSWSSEKELLAAPRRLRGAIVTAGEEEEGFSSVKFKLFNYKWSKRIWIMQRVTKSRRSYTNIREVAKKQKKKEKISCALITSNLTETETGTENTIKFILYGLLDDFRIDIYFSWKSPCVLFSLVEFSNCGAVSSKPQGIILAGLYFLQQVNPAYISCKAGFTQIFTQKPTRSLILVGKRVSLLEMKWVSIY